MPFAMVRMWSFHNKIPSKWHACNGADAMPKHVIRSGAWLGAHVGVVVCGVRASASTVHAEEFSKCTTYACDTVQMNFSLEPCVRCHEVSRTRNYNTESDHKTGHHSVYGEGKENSASERDKRHTGSEQILHSV